MTWNNKHKTKVTRRAQKTKDEQKRQKRNINKNTGQEREQYLQREKKREKTRHTDRQRHTRDRDEKGVNEGRRGKRTISKSGMGGGQRHVCGYGCWQVVAGA